ncbi:MAG: hypothetical protein LBJ09_02965 [Clostridiales bacterium]|jgi:hypothetical protein|nr:hypothetical protein [Clostridiales bacterium]
MSGLYVEEEEILIIKQYYEFLKSIYEPLSVVVELEQKSIKTGEDIAKFTTSYMKFVRSLTKKRQKIRDQQQNEGERKESSLLNFLKKSIAINDFANPTSVQDRRKLKDTFDRALSNTM